MIMRMAGISQERAMPKALRHAFGVGGTQAGVPLNVIQKWLGHADIQTTAIYTNVMGDEERLLADRMWM
jgi:site-specific recombinase XerD